MVKKIFDNRYGVSTNPKGSWSSSMVRMVRLYWQYLWKVSHATWSVCYGLNMQKHRRVWLWVLEWPTKLLWASVSLFGKWDNRSSYLLEMLWGLNEKVCTRPWGWRLEEEMEHKERLWWLLFGGEGWSHQGLAQDGGPQPGQWGSFSSFGNRHMRCCIRKPGGSWALARQTLHWAQKIH